MRLRWWAALFAILFAYAAVLQYNDPDPLRWVAIYAAAAAISLAGGLGRSLPFWLPAAIGALALVWAAGLIPGVLREAAWTWNEQERELGGLLIVSAWMLLLARRQRAPARPRSTEAPTAEAP